MPTMRTSVGSESAAIFSITWARWISTVRGLMLRNLGAEIMQADIRSPESLSRILKGVDTVIHLGARAAFEAYSKLYPSIVTGIGWDAVA